MIQRLQMLLQAENWLLLPPGNLAIAREPLSVSPSEFGPSQSEFRLATGAELLVANLGHPFPWGHSPDASKSSRLWRDHRIGVGGLKFSSWFLTQDGRFGGAPNVIQTLPGSLRYCMLLDGGKSADDFIEENEGYAVVRTTTEADRNMYRQVQLHVAQYVAADGGAIAVSPVDEDNVVHVAFCGRCQTCPNPELISIKQLQTAVPEYEFKLWSEWQNWSV